MNNAVTVSNIQSRLPMPQGLKDQDSGKWRVLCESIFPNAKTAEAIVMALDYCRVRNLDPLKKPVNIVPMWSSQLGREVETVWPSINEVQITATRTGVYAGLDKPVWGPDKTKVFKGIKKGNVGETEVELTFPEYCEVTVYKMVHGVRCPFTEQVFWEEAYARLGKSVLPNDMWSKRPHGQLHKCTKAASLRAAFPEEADYTSDEMEGRVIEDFEGVAIKNIDPVTGETNKAAPFWKTAALRKTFVEDIQKKLNEAKSVSEANEIVMQVKDKLDGMRKGDSRDELGADSIQNTYRLILTRFTEVAKQNVSSVPIEDGGLTEEELVAWEQERAMLNGKIGGLY